MKHAVGCVLSPIPANLKTHLDSYIDIQITLVDDMNLGGIANMSNDRYEIQK